MSKGMARALGRGDRAQMQIVKEAFDIPSQSVVVTNPAAATVTFTNGTNIVNLATHGLATGDGPIRLATTDTLPAELSTGTDYWVIYVAAGTFQLATSLANALAGTALAFTDDGTGTHSITKPGWGTAVLAKLPTGNVLMLGATFRPTFVKGDTDIIDAFDGDYALGSNPVADANSDFRDSGESDVLASTAMTQGSSGTSSDNRGASAVAAMINNTDGSKEVNLNLRVDDADISDDSSLTVTGRLVLLYSVLDGDDF